MEVQLIFTDIGRTDNIIDNIFTNTKVGIYVTVKGLLCVKSENELTIRKVKDEVFHDTETNKKFCFKDGKFVFIDKPRGVIAEVFGTPSVGDLQTIFKKYPDIDYVISGHTFIKQITSCKPNPNSPYQGYQGSTFIGDYLFEGFEYIDIQLNKTFIWKNGKFELVLKDKN